MKLYVFTSENLTNIWAGIGARLWALAKSQENIRGIVSKAEKMLTGSFGIFYCSETKSFTTPFLVYSGPRNRSITNVWQEEAILPFGIHPLGTPHRQLTTEKATMILPALRANTQAWQDTMRIQPTTVFVPAEISEDDWRILVEELADREIAAAHVQ